ncbi:MAG: helix-turn-helix transcriptional regulator [Arenicellales bacterium]|nr:helix-turn-helix transcriptional regulator [Arenicellales bacterium]
MSAPLPSPQHKFNKAGRFTGQQEFEDYIASIADRVKAIRARRGMTRKLLSAHSGVSERYLSQVETGKANISVALLWRIAQAMDVGVQELLPGYDNREHSSLFKMIENMGPAQQEQAYLLLKEQLRSQTASHGIALIGLRGAGKSELGGKLGRLTGIPFIDLVDVVEKISGMNVGELFALGGQKAYRRSEYEALNYVLEHFPKAIVEAGGSLVTQADTYNELLHHYYTIWLKAKPEEHMQRVIAQGDMRPMQGNTEAAMDDLKRILTEREKEYQAAHYVLNTTERSVDSCFEELLEQVAPFLQGRS